MKKKNVILLIALFAIMLTVTVVAYILEPVLGAILYMIAGEWSHWVEIIGVATVFTGYGFYIFKQ